jgi:ABC-2 type transport system permease protein
MTMPSHPPRPMYWSVRRELWENRSIYIAPLIVAAVFLFGFLISMVTLPRRMKDVAALDAAKQDAAVNMPFNVIAGLLAVTVFVVGVFYCLDALHGERRDRSILFWKSLPVSDRTTVLSKAAIPLIVLPLLVLTIVIVMHVLMLAISTAVLLGSGSGAATFWRWVSPFRLILAVIYSLTAIALWHAPIYAWLLLLSGWAKRATILWVVMPPLMLGAFERLAFGTTHVASLVGYRVAGWYMRAVVQGTGRALADPLASLTPGRFLSTPGLWLGLIFAAVFLAAAIRQRRNREPI